MVYNYRSGAARIAGYGIGRRYGRLGEFELPGTADLVNTDEAQERRCAAVYDYKTGANPPPAAENLQLQFSALCVRRIYDVDNVSTYIVQVRPSVLPSGELFFELFFDEARYGLGDWGRIEERIRRVVGRVERQLELLAQGQPLDVTQGPHCRYCNAYVSCPATLALARSIAEASGDPLLAELLAGGDALSEEQAARIAAWTEEASRFLWRIRDALGAGERSRPKYLPADQEPC
jgi:hypothetical protein